MAFVTVPLEEALVYIGTPGQKIRKDTWVNGAFWVFNTVAATPYYGRIITQSGSLADTDIVNIIDSGNWQKIT